MRAIVVGAGVIGAATAWRLRQRGVAVTLADPAPGGGATRAAGGMLAAISEVQYGQDRLYPLMLDSAAEYPAFLAELSTWTDLTTGYDTAGTLVAAADRGDRDALAQLAEVQHRHGMAVEELSGRAARRLEPALGTHVVAAFHTPDDHQVDPRLLAAALLDAARRPDRPGPPATLVRKAVRSVEPGSPAIVRFDDGTQKAADVVVLAPGLGLSGIDGVAVLPQRAVYGDVVRLRVSAPLIAPGQTGLLRHTLRGLVHGVPIYLVPRANGHLVLGATSREDAVDAVSAGGVFRLLRDGSTLVPALLEAELVETLARARPGSPDDIPMIGRTAPGVVLSCGYFRHGILLTALGSRLTADLVCNTVQDDDLPRLAVTDPTRFDLDQACGTAVRPRAGTDLDHHYPKEGRHALHSQR